MRININNNKIFILNFVGLLDGYRELQLMHWGYRLVHDVYQKETVDITNDTMSLTNYLDNEGVPFVLSDEVIELLRTHKEKEKSFNEIINRCRAIKIKDYDKVDFEKHAKFLSDNMLVSLKDHQIISSYHMYNAVNGANFSVPGSGKTAVVLSCYERQRQESRVDKLIVIGPLASFPEWEKQFKLFLGREPKTLILAGGEKDARKSRYYGDINQNELVLTSFQTLLNDVEEIEFLLKRYKGGAYIVVDEAHYIKQIGGNWAEAVLSLAKYANVRSILTGTPAPKSYLDFVNIFNFLWPNKDLISDKDKILIENFESNKQFHEAASIIRQKIDPLFYRVAKKDLKLDKQIFYPPEKIIMNPIERKLYDLIEERIASLPLDYYFSNKGVLDKLKKGRMIRYRQVLSYPTLLKTALEETDNNDIIDSEVLQLIGDYDNNEQPAKITRLLEIVKKLQHENEKVVIWSSFIGTIELIVSKLAESGINSKVIIGATPTIEGVGDMLSREEIRQSFVDPNSGIDVLVANPAACSESISLHTTCSNAIYYDLSFNAAQYLQSLDRIHRVAGSENKKSYYHYLQYANTSEHKILDNLELKAKKMYEIIDKEITLFSLDMQDETEEIDAYTLLFGKE